MRNLLNRDELRRLEKAAREKDKKKLAEWAAMYDDQLRRDYEENYKDEISNAVDNFLLAVAYTLRFSEETEFGPKRLPAFMEDMYATIDMFRTGEYKPEEYKEALKKSGVILTAYDYPRIFRKRIDDFMKDLTKMHERCKNCKFNVEGLNPETGKVEFYMCRNKKVLDEIMENNFRKEACKYREEK